MPKSPLMHYEITQFASSPILSYLRSKSTHHFSNFSKYLILMDYLTSHPWNDAIDLVLYRDTTCNILYYLLNIEMFLSLCVTRITCRVQRDVMMHCLFLLIYRSMERSQRGTRLTLKKCSWSIILKKTMLFLATCEWNIFNKNFSNKYRSQIF